MPMAEVGGVKPTATIIVTDAALAATSDQFHLIEHTTGHGGGLHPDHG
jgi:hypothetical protein